MQPNKLIAIYARVSTSTQEEQQTIQNQIRVLKEYATQHNYTIIQEYLDDGWSGDSLARPNLDNLRQDAKKKLWEAVLIYDPDRLARRYSYQELVMDELAELGIEVLFVTVTKAKTVDERMMNGVRGLFAEYERVKISERFRLGKVRKTKEGNVLVSEAPYGYTYIPKIGNTHGYYKIHEEESRIVKSIFTWIVDEGLTLHKIIKRLQELEIKPRKSKRGVWSTSTLSTLIRNKTYIGEAHWGASYAVVPDRPINTEKYKKIKKTSRRAKPESEWTIIPVPPIMDRNIFNKAQEQMVLNFSLCQRSKKNEYLLSGKLYCTCGTRRNGEGVQSNKHLYYRCANRVHNFPLPKTCLEKGISARIADEAVWKKISELMSSPELLKKQVERWMNAQQQHTKQHVDKEVVRKDIERMKLQEDRYNQAYAGGLFSIEQLRDYVLPLKSKMQALETQLAVVSEEIDPTLIPNEESMSTFAEEAKKALVDLSYEQKRAIILTIVDKICGTKEKLTIIGHIPLNNYVFFSKHRHRRPPQRW